MLRWREAFTFNGIAIEHIPLFEGEEYFFVLNYVRGYETRSGGWLPGYFFIGVVSKKAPYGHLFVNKIDNIETAEEVCKWTEEFTAGLFNVSVGELKEIIKANGNLAGLTKE